MGEGGLFSYTQKGNEYMSHAVIIKKAVKKYGDFTALNGVDLDIKQGEFFTLLGPSGCGKTTLLRMIAGFNSVDGGEICFDDKVEEALDLVQIKNLKDRKPNALSGGQQQRVALARAFVIEPGVLLMDEPLSNLDAKLRVQMRTVIKKLQRRLGITTVYVTHDQEEALAISDRIAVMKDGNIMQVGSPEDIYKKPANTFVAGFIGVSNFIECQVDGKDPEQAVLDIKGECTLTCRLKTAYNGTGIISARPEQLFFDEEGLPGKIVISTFLGDFIEYEILLNQLYL